MKHVKDVFGNSAQKVISCNPNPQLYVPPSPSLFITTRLTAHVQIDRLNLEGYANLEHWVAELDKRIEGTFLQRPAHIIQVWCAEFDRVDDSATRRDLLPVRDVASKRRG
jgi:hypothetical protein